MINQFWNVISNGFFKCVCNCSITIIMCNDSSSVTSADKDSDTETTDAMESSLPNPDVTLDDDLSATDDQEPCSTSGEMIVRLHCEKC